MKILTTFMLIGLSSIAFAADEAWNEREYLTGDWGGLRTSIEDKGIEPFLYYDSIAAANVSGGIQTDDQYTGQVYGGLNLDLEKLLGWDATTAKISMVNRHGNGIAGSVGGIYDPMTINGGADGQVTWLYQVWIEKMFGEDWAVKFGRTSMDEDFADNDLNRYSLSTSINGPIRSMMLQNPQIFSFPLALWGGRVKYKLSDEHQFQLGAYQINDNPFGTHVRGTNWGISSDDGVTFMAQYDWTPDVFDRPARVYIGIANSVYDFKDFDGGETSNLLTFYWHGDFEVIDGLKLFAFGAYNSQDETAKIPLQINGGANWKGLIPGRENDHTVFFTTYGKVSDVYGKYVTKGDVDAEIVFELGHRIQIIPSFYIQPSVQYIRKPGGTGVIDDAVVLGAWIGASF
ncbi:MAG: carbohydrate porin [Methylomonas sp.]|jgi:carbohydrate-selective porin OprB|uniref:carbohydrate porin n=1 Tax=Methylomonas sp. TaxID=418 RepID=UPI0025D52335|nr:carbohydrate porin [Methylomonas sp.]MCK9609324.1 carbohydrate porin [Methylomonas sp.]